MAVCVEKNIKECFPGEYYLNPNRPKNLDQYELSVCYTMFSSFPGPLMSPELQKDRLMKYIQIKRHRCLLHLAEHDHQKTFFFWSIMELFCNRNGSVMMCEIGARLFQGYSFIMRKLQHAKRDEDWCLPLAKLLCSNTPIDELRQQIIKMGDEFASREWAYAAQICYVAAQLELGSRDDFILIGCFSDSVAIDSYERTEVYEYVLSLTSGFGQRSFQEVKIFYCHDQIKCGVPDHMSDYCHIIAAELLRFPQCHDVDLLQQTISLFELVLNMAQEKAPECLKELHSLLDKAKTKLSDHSGFESRYTMGKKLGHGSFGTVYAGVRKSDGKEVAIKCADKGLQDEKITIPGETCSLPLEVGLLKLVSKAPHCENVVELLEWFETPSVVIMVLERPNPCIDLFDFWESKNYKLPDRILQKIMLQVVEAAKHCCDREVFHRDIKPENILINPNTLEIKLIDFGAGELLHDGIYHEYAGTLEFYPPEWVLHKKYHGIPATVWSLGVLLFVLACGEYPFENKDEIVAGHLPFTFGISRGCTDLIMRCLEQDPKQRPTLDEILDCEWMKQEQ